MAYQSQAASNKEVVGTSGEPESNLSETAKFVKNVMDEIIMPKLNEMGLVKEANQIISKKLSPDSPEHIDFSLKCRQAEADCFEKITDGDEKKEAVVRNYFAKLIRAVQGPSETPSDSL